jgi:ATP-dependent Clp protease ATP-binding subunit ClpC
MSEYSDKTSVNKLIWASAWYIWYEEWWLLTEKIRKKPYSVILFDEIEKWDIEVYNLLLQILEEWILTDNKWRKVNFKNTIIILTSNIWQEEFLAKASQIGFNISDKKENSIMEDYDNAKKNIIWNLTDYFSPEFINRIDKILDINPLDKKNIKKIVLLQIKELEVRLEKKGFKLKYDNKVINYITKNVYNPEFWAREIRRYLIDNLEDTIAEKIIRYKTKKQFEIKIEKNNLIII